MGATQADATRPPSAQHPPHSASHSSDNTNDGTGEKDQQKAKKASFMAKMKGEAKVLIGKIEKKQDKVEEGQRIKAGEPAQSQTA